MKKVTDLKKNECILCTTLEECDAILDLMHEAGLKWNTGGLYKDERDVKYLPNKCYYPYDGAYSDKAYAKECWYKIYTASDFIFAPKRGDVIEVSDSNEKREKRIFLAKIKWAKSPFICVWASFEEVYKKWEKFIFSLWKCARPIQPERKPRTIEATDEEWESIQKQLGI